MTEEDAASPPEDTPAEATQLGTVEPYSPDRTAIDVTEDLTADVTSGSCSGRICYHGGSIMSQRVQIYYIWYGDWSGSAVPPILRDFAESLGNTPYYRLNTTYSDSSGAAVNGRLGFGGNTWVGYTHGRSLTNGDVGAIVRSAITNGRLPYDRNGIYFVMGSRGVFETGLCSSICAWHSAQSIALPTRGPVALPVLYGFVGNPVYCEDHHTTHTCQVQATGPNGSSAADGMANLLAHEISETVTDPHLDAWYGSNHAETGDLCAWTFGTTFTAPNGAEANLHLGTRDWLLQRIYDRALQRCTH
jgi:hypothetical protein